MRARTRARLLAEQQEAARRGRMASAAFRAANLADNVLTGLEADNSTTDAWGNAR